MRVRFCAAVLVLLAASRVFAQDTPAPRPSPLANLDYSEMFFPGATYDAQVPTPSAVLGFPVGSKPATHAQIEAVIKAIAGASPRCKLVRVRQDARGPHALLPWSSPPRPTSRGSMRSRPTGPSSPTRARRAKDEVDRLAATLPAVAWMAYVHSRRRDVGLGRVARRRAPPGGVHRCRVTDAARQPGRHHRSAHEPRRARPLSLDAGAEPHRAAERRRPVAPAHRLLAVGPHESLPLRHEPRLDLRDPARNPRAHRGHQRRGIRSTSWRATRWARRTRSCSCPAREAAESATCRRTCASGRSSSARTRRRHSTRAAGATTPASGTTIGIPGYSSSWAALRGSGRESLRAGWHQHRCRAARRRDAAHVPRSGAQAAREHAWPT